MMRFVQSMLLLLMTAASLSAQQPRFDRAQSRLVADPSRISVSSFAGIVLSGNIPSATGAVFVVVFKNDGSSSVNTQLKMIFEKDGQALGSGTSGFVRVDAGQEYRLTNNSLLSGQWKFSGKSEDGASQLLEDILSAGGRFPSGAYALRFQLFADNANNQVDEVIIPFTIQSLSEAYINLIYPPAGLEPTEINTPFPTIRWQGDAATYRVSIFQDPTNSGNIGLVRNNVPMVNQIVSQASFQYPAGGVRPLQAGGQYVLLIEAEVAGKRAEALSVFRMSQNLSGNSSSGNSASTSDELVRTLFEKYGSSAPDWLRNPQIRFSRFSGTVRGTEYSNSTNAEIIIQALNEN